MSISDSQTAMPCARCGTPTPLEAPCQRCGHDPAGPGSAGANGSADVPSGAHLGPGAGGGDVFPDYVVLRKVATGGLGTVYEGHPVGFPSERCAIKVIRADLGAAAASLDPLFRREAVALRRVVDPGVVRVFDLGRTADGRTFLVMDWIPGRSLDEALHDPASALGDPGHPDLPGLAADLVRHLGRALDAAHGADVVHLDLKPSNVLLASEPPHALQPVLIDFGIAQLRGQDDHSDASTGAGTVEHMAPEVARNEPGTRLTDVYLLAHLLYRVLTGRRHTTGQIRSLRRIDRRFVPGLDDLFLEAMADEPDDRPASCGEFAARLELLLGDVTRGEAEAAQAAQRAAEENARRNVEARQQADRERLNLAAQGRKKAELQERQQAEHAAQERAAAEKQLAVRRQREAEEVARKVEQEELRAQEAKWQADEDQLAADQEAGRRSLMPWLLGSIGIAAALSLMIIVGLGFKVGARGDAVGEERSAAHDAAAALEAGGGDRIEAGGGMAQPPTETRRETSTRQAGTAPAATSQRSSSPSPVRVTSTEPKRPNPAPTPAAVPANMVGKWRGEHQGEALTVWVKAQDSGSLRGTIQTDYLNVSMNGTVSNSGEVRISFEGTSLSGTLGPTPDLMSGSGWRLQR